MRIFNEILASRVVFLSDPISHFSSQSIVEYKEPTAHNHYSTNISSIVI